MSNPNTTELLRRLTLRAQYPDNGNVDGVSASEDWQMVKTEIERLREIVWLYVDPSIVKPAYSPVVERCKQ